MRSWSRFVRSGVFGVGRALFGVPRGGEVVVAGGGDDLGLAALLAGARRRGCSMAIRAMVIKASARRWAAERVSPSAGWEYRRMASLSRARPSGSRVPSMTPMPSISVDRCTARESNCSCAVVASRSGSACIRHVSSTILKSAWGIDVAQLHSICSSRANTSATDSAQAPASSRSDDSARSPPAKAALTIGMRWIRSARWRVSLQNPTPSRVVTISQSVGERNPLA